MTITAHLAVSSAQDAARFYRDAFGAREISRLPTPDGRLMSLVLELHGSLLHLCDEFPERGVVGPLALGGSPVVLGLDVDDAAAVFAAALGAGAQVRQPLGEVFWGDLHGQVEDPFGQRWNISQHLHDVPADELTAAVARAFS